MSTLRVLIHAALCLLGSMLMLGCDGGGTRPNHGGIASNIQRDQLSGGVL